MNSLTCKHIDFVPDKMVNKAPIKNCIYIFSRKRGHRINKNKTLCVGFISKYEGKYCLCSTYRSIVYTDETMRIIYGTICKLNSGVIVFSAGKGTLELR